MLTVIIITKNEAVNIRRCLMSVAFASEIIVLDSGSTDDTVSIARTFTPHVYQTDWQGYGIQKQRALDYATCPWVLNLDADESISDALQAEIKAVIQADQYDACRVPIQMCFYQKPLRFSSSPSRHARLFKRAKAHFSADIVHEKIILDKSYRIGQLKNPILHHSFQDLSHAVEKMNRYSSYSAKIRIQHKKRPSFSKTMASTLWMFIRCYFLQGGFLDGKVGFLFAALNAQGAFLRGMKQLYQDKQIALLPPVEGR